MHNILKIILALMYYYYLHPIFKINLIYKFNYIIKYKNMYFRNIFRILFKEEKKLLGRWTKIKDQQILDYKIHLANSDSCYHSSIYQNINNKNIINFIKDEKNL